MHCEGVAPDADQLGVNVTDITFGTGWDSNNNKVINTGTTFYIPPDIYVIYYEICFEEQYSAGGMIKKKWKLDGQPLFETTSFMPKVTRRICGEIQYYLPDESMDVGEYELSIWWYSSTQQDYLEYKYSSGVNQTFEIRYNKQ